MYIYEMVDARKRARYVRETDMQWKKMRSELSALGARVWNETHRSQQIIMCDGDYSVRILLTPKGAFIENSSTILCSNRSVCMPVTCYRLHRIIYHDEWIDNTVWSYVVLRNRIYQEVDNFIARNRIKPGVAYKMYGRM